MAKHLKLGWSSFLTSIALFAIAIPSAAQQGIERNFISAANWLVVGFAVLLHYVIFSSEQLIKNKLALGVAASMFFLSPIFLFGNFIWITAGPFPILTFCVVLLTIWVLPTAYIIYSMARVRAVPK